MDDIKDLELDADGMQSNLGGAPQAVRKAISLNLTKRTKMRAKSSSAKSNKSSRRDRKERDTDDGMDGKSFRRSSKSSYDKKKETDEDDREDEELDWSHTVIMIGEKVQDPMIHMCEECNLPILIYGRLNPCKHVFCYSCADKSNSVCPRCTDRVDRIEPAGIGQIFVCSFGGSRNDVSGCRRSYLSQRDLIAHIKHRHEKEGSNIPEAELLRQQGALRMPFFNTPSVSGGTNVLINNLQTSTSAPGLQNPMVISGVQPGSQPQIFVDPNRLSLLQPGQVQLQALPQMALATQSSFQGASATTAYLQTQPQQQFPPAGLPQGGPQSGGRPPADPRLNPNQQTMNMQSDWRGNAQNTDWQGRSNRQSYYK